MAKKQIEPKTEESETSDTENTSNTPDNVQESDNAQNPEGNAEEKKELTEEEKQQKEEEENEKEHALESYRKAGEIYRQVVDFITPQIVVGSKVLDLCLSIEGKTTELGGDVGFPANIGINNVAAHYSSPRDDETVIIDGDIVKIDLGVAVDGYVVDAAFTISFNQLEITQNLITAVDTAVLKGLSMIKPGVKTNEVGEATYKVIHGFNYNVIKDLCGHMIDRWTIHGGYEIPNVPTPTGVKFEEGQVWALECFATTGAGKIHASENCYIYSLNTSTERVPLRGKVSRHALGWIVEHKQTLPFSSRELLKEFQAGQFALRELVQYKKLIEHNVLKENEKEAYIAQSEHTFMVTSDGIERFT
jgi:methionyl aminopeptidase